MERAMVNRTTLLDAESEEDDDNGVWEDWTDATAGVDVELGVTCLFCNKRESSAAAIFNHCSVDHHFNFATIRRDWQLGFYDSLKLLNFIRSSVAAQICWNCQCAYQSQQELFDHLNAACSGGLFLAFSARTTPEKELRVPPWDDEKYLTPFIKNDPLLYSLEYEDEDEVEDEEAFDLIEKSKVMSELSTGIFNVYDDADNNGFSRLTTEFNMMHDASISDVDAAIAKPTGLSTRLTSELPLAIVDNTFSSGNQDEVGGFHEVANLIHNSVSSCSHPLEDVQHMISNLMPSKGKNIKVSFASVADKEVQNINQNYFKSYGEFGIHREMLSDKVRTDAYRDAILSNPLFKNAVVMDVGCGTGILSLFAAQAGASKIIAVDGSDKMVSVAREVAKANGFLRGEHGAEGIISVFEGMIEDLDLMLPLEGQGVDVIVSEWMGYCLLFESMLGSVLHARDRWLKSDGAILPDKAELYVAGFGKGGTSLRFWENVYGFNMQCVGEEVHQNAAQFPIVDTLDSKDVITNSCILQVFDLRTMKQEDADFTAEFQLTLLSCSKCHYRDSGSGSLGNHNYKNEVPEIMAKCDIQLCYGLVVWFDTKFSDKFCKERPVRLSTSPFEPKTHWSQTLLTLKKPIALLQASNDFYDCTDLECLGTEKYPAQALSGRISIAKSFRHRSIDISLEIIALGGNGKKRAFPVQMFDI